jgi:signal transduction histidine kinase
VWLLNPDGPGPVLEWPASAEALYGASARDVLGRARAELFASEPARAGWGDVERALREFGRWEGEFLHATHDGRRVLTESRLVLVDELSARGGRSGDAAPDGPVAPPLVVEIARDVTARRVAEEALHASQDRLAAIIGSALDAIVTTDAAGQVVLFNAAAERLFGRPATAAIGEPLDRFVRGHARGSHPGALLGVHADGAEFPIEAATSHVDTPAGRLSTIIVRDVTERLHAEAERERLIDALERERVRLAESARHADAARAEADAARREAEAASQAKSAFLATMSHELRTPLNAVLGYVDLLDLGIAGEVTDAQRAYVERIGASGRHLLGLINDVLDLAKIEAGQLSVSRQPYPASAAVRAALALVRPQAAARALVVEDAGCGPEGGADPVGPAYVGDERRVQQILANLLSNAVKFTAPGGRVQVTCATTREPPPGRAPGAGRGTWLTVRVRDTGVGIAPEQHEMVFARFHQVNHGDAGPYRRTQGGTGLGLAISRELARLMGGDLTVESEAGSGSAFTLWLPAAAPAIAGGRDTAGAGAGRCPRPRWPSAGCSPRRCRRWWPRGSSGCAPIRSCPTRGDWRGPRSRTTCPATWPISPSSS